MEEKNLERNQLCYIIEAALEYFVSMLVAGAFLASILVNIGVPDAVTGVITTLTSLGISAQLFAVLFIRPKGTLKKAVTLMHFVNQLMFVTLYLIPYINIPHGVKVAVFIIMFLGGHLIHNCATPFRLSWLMSYVPDKVRGRFTANKEIISLLSGIVFSYAMGAVIDKYEALGNPQTGFVLSGITLLVLSVMHLLSLVFIKEDKTEVKKEEENGRTVREVLGITVFDKDFRKIILLDILWHIGNGLTVAFYGTYQINELGFNLKYVAILSALSSLSRVLFSKPMGKFADKYSWAKMMIICFIMGAAAFFVNIFTMPSNGKILYAIYMILYGAFMAGANSGMMNIVFDYVKTEDRAYALGVKSALGGIAGFIASLVGAKIVSSIQAGGNVFYGMNIYAQQILSFISFVLYLFIVFYVKKVIMKMKKL